MSDALSREVERQRAKLLALEDRGAAEIGRSYEVVRRDLNRRLAALTKQIAAARAAGEDVHPNWLARQHRFEELIFQQEQLTLRFLRESLRTIESSKAEAIESAHIDQPRLANAAMGPAPAAAQGALAESFTRLPEREITALIRNAADGTPLADLLANAAPGSTEGLKDALFSGVARGAGVRQIARDVRAASGISQSRALTIVRTEVLRAYRETARDLYSGSNAVRGWVWFAEATACPVCMAEHGSEHPADEVLASHPCCRCTMVPKTLSWRELGFDVPDRRPSIETGPERFAAMSEADQLVVVGRARLDAYNAGKITLRDMVRETSDPRWGPGKRVATLEELSLA